MYNALLSHIIETYLVFNFYELTFNMLITESVVFLKTMKADLLYIYIFKF